MAHKARPFLAGYARFMPSRRRAGLSRLALGLCLLWAAGAEGGTSEPAPDLDLARWEPLALPRVDAQTRYETRREGQRAVVRSQSRCSASALAIPLDGVDLDQTPILHWSWKVEAPLPEREERSKEGDDFAARVYLTFRLDPERASWRERALNRLGRALYGREVPGGALNYVWATNEPAGSTWDNPFVPSSKMISLGTGPLPKWRRERVDVLRDYAALLGGEPPDPLGLAIMTDSDNSCGEAAAWFADFGFSARDGSDRGEGGS